MMRTGRNARPFSVSRYSASPSRMPFARKVRSRSEMEAGGAPRRSSNSPNRVAPRNAAIRSAADQRFPNTLMVCGNKLVDVMARGAAFGLRRLADAGTDRDQEPLGPQ